jgi:hypothetical protein
MAVRFRPADYSGVKPLTRRKFVAVGRTALVGAVSLASFGHAAKARATGPMSGDERVDWFWGIIERSRLPGADQAAQMAALSAELAELPTAEIEAFGAVFDRLLRETYSWDLWGAAYVILGGASDDAFEFFGVWLICCGRAVFERARANPDELATLIPAGFDDAPDFESLAYVASKAWAKKTGRESNEMPTQPNMAYDHEPSGEPFDEEGLARRYPRLWARFAESPLQ